MERPRPRASTTRYAVLTGLTTRGGQSAVLNGGTSRSAVRFPLRLAAMTVGSSTTKCTRLPSTTLRVPGTPLSPGAHPVEALRVRRGLQEGVGIRLQEGRLSGRAEGRRLRVPQHAAHRRHE